MAWVQFFRKRAKYFKIWAKKYKVENIFKKDRQIPCDNRTQKTATIGPDYFSMDDSYWNLKLFCFKQVFDGVQAIALEEIIRQKFDNFPRTVFDMRNKRKHWRINC